MHPLRPDNFGGLSPTQAWRVDAVCGRFEADLRDGYAPRIEDFVAQADPLQRVALLRELIALDVELRRDRGERPDALEYRARFPDHDTGIAAIFDRSRPPPSSEDRAPRISWPHNLSLESRLARRPLQALAKDRRRGDGRCVHGRTRESYPATSGPEDHQVLLGFVAQALFTMRFLVQWIAANAPGTASFRWRSGYSRSAAALLLLVYALYRKDRCSSPARRSVYSSICAISISCCATARATSASPEHTCTPPRQSAAKPRSRSARRSSTASSPIWNRTVGPPGSQLVAVRSGRSRTEWRGSRSRPRRRRCRTVRARRERHRPLSAAPA